MDSGEPDWPAIWECAPRDARRICSWYLIQWIPHRAMRGAILNCISFNGPQCSLMRLISWLYGNPCRAMLGAILNIIS
eukprot:9655025-Karenia_brevis.AAC.1